MAYVIDEFLTENGKRKITLERHASLQKPWIIVVRIPDRHRNKAGTFWIILSTAEYYDEDNARHDFERRRPQMHEERGEVPMQRGKRLVQDMMTEKLGPRS